MEISRVGMVSLCYLVWKFVFLFLFLSCMIGDCCYYYSSDMVVLVDATMMCSGDKESVCWTSGAWTMTPRHHGFLHRDSYLNRE